MVTIFTTEFVEKFYVQPTQCIYLSFICLSEQRAVIFIYTGNGLNFTMCLLRGTSRIFKYDFGESYLQMVNGITCNSILMKVSGIFRCCQLGD